MAFKCGAECLLLLVLLVLLLVLLVLPTCCFATVVVVLVLPSIVVVLSFVAVVNRRINCSGKLHRVKTSVVDIPALLAVTDCFCCCDEAIVAISFVSFCISLFQGKKIVSLFFCCCCLLLFLNRFVFFFS